MAPIEAAARPFPSDDTTPPVTKMYFVCRPVVESIGRLTYGLRPADAGERVPDLRACRPQWTGAGHRSLRSAGRARALEVARAPRDAPGAWESARLVAGGPGADR